MLVGEEEVSSLCNTVPFSRRRSSAWDKELRTIIHSPADEKGGY